MRKLYGMRFNKNNNVSLTTLLTGLVSLSVLMTSTILLIASYQSKKQSLIETTLSLNLSNAEKMSQTADSLFISMRGSLQYNAGTFTDIDAMDEQEINKNLEHMRRSSNYFNSIIIVDETGIIRSVSPESIGSRGKAISGAAAKDALASRKPYVSRPYTTATTGRLILFMSEPLYDKKGTYRGFIGGTLYLQENNILNMIFGSTTRDDTGSYFYIVGSDGHLLYHPDKERIGEDVTANKVVHKLIQGKSGQEEVVNTRGVNLLAGYSSVPANGWGVVAVSPTSMIYEQLMRQLGTILLYTLPPFVLLMLAVVLLARRLARPFVSLANLVSTVGTEKFSLPESKRHWNREADLLTEAIHLALADFKKERDQLTHDAITDPLTGLMNRRTLESIMNQWTVEQSPFAIIILDIDRFKSVNDTYGHQTGDEVLKFLAATVSSAIRPIDICCRYGGEEFVVLLHHATEDEAYAAAEEIRRTLEQTPSPIGKPVTISLGIAQFPAHADSPDELFHLADQALYQAKESGRNRTVVAGTAAKQHSLHR